MWRAIAVMLACVLMLGVAEAPPKKPPSAFDILGASVIVTVTHDGQTLPATLVPSLQRGDTINISFPKGVQFSRTPRWHLVVAYLYDDYLRHPPTFPIPDGDLSRAKPGYTWHVKYQGNATPVIFLVPESGNRYGHGIPDARGAISDLQNRALLLRTATLSANAAAKESILDSFLGSMSSIQPGSFNDGRSRVEAAAQSLFGSNLGSEACFSSSAAQSTQYACAAQAVTSGYANSPSPNVAAAVGTQLAVNTATYGMLIGSLYELLAKRRVMAHYEFVPGVIKPGSSSTNVYVHQQPEYDPSAAKPSTIVYFEIGSQGTNPGEPSYGAAPALPVCLAGNTLDVTMPFSGSPAYFRSHTMVIKAGPHMYEVPASYDPVQGYSASLTSAQRKALANGGSAKIRSAWGFRLFSSPAVGILEPRAATWALQKNPPADIVSGDGSATLTFTDGNAGMGSCVQDVTLHDGLGAALPVSDTARTKNSVTVTLDATDAQGAAGSAVVNESGNFASTALTFPIYPAMPKITSAIAYLPKGELVLKGTGLKYINTVTLEHTGIVFGSGTPSPDGSWAFTARKHAAYVPAWEHETMAISFTLEPPDTRTDAVEADVQYAPATPALPPPPPPSPSPSPSPAPSP
jgi:hypothetical protein